MNDKFRNDTEIKTALFESYFKYVTLISL